jgi:chromosome segregation ATPase
VNWHTENTTIASPTPDTALVRFNVQRAALDQLKTYQAIVVDLDDKESIKQAKQAWSITRDLRLKIQRREKALNADLNKQKKELKGDAQAIINEIKETEDHLDKELEKVKRAEEERKAKIEENMAILTRHCEAGLAEGLTSDQIEPLLQNLETTEIPKDIFQEQYQTACDLLNHAIEETRARLAAVRQKEEEAAEIARLKQELKEKEDVNRQVAWFNETFGFAGTLDGMEAGMVTLEEMERPAHLAELIEQQIEQGQVVLERARAAASQPAPEPETAQKPTSDTTTSDTPATEPEPTQATEKTWGHSEPQLHRDGNTMIEKVRSDLDDRLEIIENALKSGQVEILVSANGELARPVLTSMDPGMVAVLELIKDSIEKRQNDLAA